MSQTLTVSELLTYDGSDTSKPVYIAVKGVVYDVSASREFYGKGGPYEVFAGRECSRALAIMKVDAAECNDNLSGCTEKQLKTLEEWIAKFATKYTVVGKLVALAEQGAASAAAPAAGEEEVYISMLLRKSPFPPSMIATLAVVGLLTLLGAYLLLLDMKQPVPAQVHSEL